MRERQYRGESIRDRSLSPRYPAPTSRNFYPSRHHDDSPRHRRGAEEYSRESDRSRRIAEKDNLDRDFFSLQSRRLRDYDGAGVGSRHSRSPRRIEKRDHFDRDANMRTIRLSDYDGGKDRVRDVVGVGSTRRLYEEYFRYVGSTSTKSQRDHLSDRPKKFDVDSMNDYNYKSDYYMAGNYNTTKSGGERDSRVGYSGELLSVSRPKKPVSMEYEKDVNLPSDPYTWASNISVGGTAKYSSVGIEGSSHLSSVAPRYLKSDTGKQEYVHFQDELQPERRDGALLDPEKNYSKNKSGDFHFQDILKLDKPVGRENYKNEKEDLLPSRENLKVSNYFLPSSQSKDYTSLSPGTFKESRPSYFSAGDTYMTSHSSQPKRGLSYEYNGFNEPNEKQQTMSPRILGHGSDDSRNSSRSYLGLAEEKRGDCLYAEFGGTEIDSPTPKPRYFEEEYKDHHVSGVGVLDSTFDKPYKRKYAENDPLWDPYPSSLGQSDPDKFNPSTSLHERKRDLGILGSGSSDVNRGSEAYLGYGDMKSRERHTELRSGPWSHEERSDVLRSRDYGSSFGGFYDSPKKTGWVSKDVSLGEPYERRLRHEHIRDEPLFNSSAGIKISCDGYGARKIYNPLDDEMDIGSLSKKPKVGKSGYDKARMMPNEMNYQRMSGKPIPRHSSNAHNSNSRDVKSRLGPRPPKPHVLQRLEKINKPSIKKRLGPTPSSKQSVLPWLKVPSSSTAPSIQDDSDGSCIDQDDHLMEQLPRSEPSEKSEEFKQLVQSAFFKFIKQINETPVKRKQYTEGGKAGGLKCIVCGRDCFSNSEEFSNTESLATHAFACEKAGLRSQHLGLHKALCVVNGWKTAELPSSVWHCEEIPNAENTALKEDIIIWPPVVIVHNSTIDKKNPDERIIVSTEELVLKLRGMGFTNIIKVCNGKPANQSLLVVKFNGTLSGLQEAERLHNSYVGTKHRETEQLQQLESSTTNASSSEGTTPAAANKENCLYGHLGVAEDLDKLDFDTKKRCVLRSKSQIFRIVDAPLDTNREKGGSC